MRKTLAALTLSLGVAGCDSPAPDTVFQLAPIVVDAGPSICPVVTGISTGSLEALLGGEIELEAFASSRGEASFRWSGGRFEPPDAAATRYLCAYPGEITLSVAVSKQDCPEVAQRIAVTCTSELCSACLHRSAAWDLLTRCTSGGFFNRVDTQRCTDALLCSLTAPDQCAADAVIGPLACYCGADSSEACTRLGAAREGPAGACVTEWEAAARCQPGDAICVIDRLHDFGRPSGVAHFVARALAVECGDVCGPQVPPL